MIKKLIFILFLSISIFPKLSMAQYPTKEIKIISPFATGGNNDITARIIADSLSKKFNNSVVVENKTGASGMIGSNYVAKSAPDGYTLLVAANSLFIAPLITNSNLYDWKKEFIPIIGVQKIPNVIVVNADSKIKTFNDLLSIGADDNNLTFADAGAGTSPHICMEMIADKTKIKYTPVHYRGNSAAISDLLNNNVTAQIDQINGLTLSHIKAGKLRALAVTSDTRIDLLPDVPTIKELKIKHLEDFVFTTNTGVFAPSNMPDDIINKIADAIEDVLNDKDVIAKFKAVNAEIDKTKLLELKKSLIIEEEKIKPFIIERRNKFQP